jgi:very-short-patch-repair endonuclease
MAKRLTSEEYIMKSSLSHNNFYDYSKVEYKNSKENIVIICPVHGEFSQNPYLHSKGHGCSQCKFEESREKRKLSDNDIILKFRNKHGDKYDYSKMSYEGLNSCKVNIICPIHGEFIQYPKNHLKYGCSACSKNKAFTIGVVLERTFEVHGLRYLYCLESGLTNKTKIQIYCEKHGPFTQVLGNHLMGKGCSRCSSSKGEMFIERYLIEKSINYIRQKEFSGCFFKRNLKFDFFLPDFGICIEFDGIQHFKPVERFGGIEYYKYVSNCDKIKEDFCQKEGLRLLRIPYNQFKNIEKIIRENL